MKTQLDSTSIDIPCPHCRRKSAQTIGKIKTSPTLTCKGCGQSFKVDARDFARDINKVEQSLAKFARTLGSLGKKF